MCFKNSIWGLKELYFIVKVYFVGCSDIIQNKHSIRGVHKATPPTSHFTRPLLLFYDDSIPSVFSVSSICRTFIIYTIQYNTYKKPLYKYMYINLQARIRSYWVEGLWYDDSTQAGVIAVLELSWSVVVSVFWVFNFLLFNNLFFWFYVLRLLLFLVLSPVFWFWSSFPPVLVFISTATPVTQLITHSCSHFLISFPQFLVFVIL